MDHILAQEHSSISVESGADSVLELFKVKVIEAVNIAKHISLEHKVAAWQFWTDISTTLKTVTEAESVSVRIDGIEHTLTSSSLTTGSNLDHTYIPTVVDVEITTACHDTDYDDSETLLHPDSLPVGEVTELPSTPLKTEKGTNVDDSQLPSLEETPAKPKRPRGRPRKRSKQTDVDDAIPCSTHVDRLIEAISTNIDLNTAPEKCNICGQKIDTQNQQQKDIPIADNKKICVGCGKVKLPKRRRRRRPVKSSDSTEFMCSLCETSFPSNEELVDHQLSTHSGEDIQNERFEDTENINTSDPDWRAEKRSRRLRHKKSKTENADEFETPKKRGRKRLNNMIPGKTTCDVCGANLSNESALEVHMRKHSGEKPFTCKLCGKGFTTKCNMQRHEKTHTGAKPYKCEECNKWFTEKKSVKVHMRSHTGEKPYKCTICGRSFAQTGILQSHMDLHTGHKGHLCDYCGKAFRQKCQLRMHQKRHFNKRSYKCEQCDACFVTKGDMDRHRLKHTGERPFLCTHCPKSFTRMQYLREHVNQHTGTKPYSCKLCTSSFHDLSTYHRHLRKHKAEEQRKVTVVYASEEVENEKEEITTVYLSNEGETEGQYEQNSASEPIHVPLTHSVITQNASGGFELTYIPQRMIDQGGTGKEIIHGGEGSVRIGDISDSRNLTFVLKDGEGAGKSDVTLFLSPEDLGRLQGVRQTSEFTLADGGERSDVHNLQQMKVTEISQISETLQNTRLITSINNGQTYEVAYVDSTSLPSDHQGMTEDDISAMNLLAPATSQQL